ncbi:unnamed protein product [Rodentolepis nana]|uniref:USP domain-containing protein n=1 Tax=Rodentolepis nana TaxID=102285 RepID=A0A0R3T5H8_RODNA|nr:unnamed protein product [Rodentolepis nana]
MKEINKNPSNKREFRGIQTASAVESWNAGPRSRISGITNHGATCYLNTLLQILFHTPDLTSFQILQEILILFSNLLKGDGTPISAKALTESFGWTSDEVHIHQDIQELNRLLFEELEDNLKNTIERNLINDLYKGCLKTTDEFQDVNLSVSDCDSIELALDNHTQTETLAGDNQYFCEICKGRVDAIKVFRND